MTSLRAHATAISGTQDLDSALASLNTSAEALTTLRAALVPLRDAVSAPGATYTSVDDCRTRARESQQWCMGYVAAQGLQASVTLPQVEAMITQLDSALTASNAATTSLGTFAGQRDQLAASATVMADRLEALLADPTPGPPAPVSPQIVERLRDSTAAVRGASTDASASITATDRRGRGHRRGFARTGRRCPREPGRRGAGCGHSRDPWQRRPGDE